MGSQAYLSRAGGLAPRPCRRRLAYFRRHGAKAPNTLFRRGFSKTSLLPGTEIVVDGYQAKDGSLRGNGRDLTFPDGRKLFLGSSGTGAPRDGRDPTEHPRP